ncbi:MAG: DUF4397 domain-containing protein [Caldimonas sp.]
MTTTTTPRSALRLFFGGVASALLLVACGGGVSPNAGKVRLVNATSEFGALDLYERSDRLTAGVAAITAGGYEDRDKGDYTFSVRGGVAGATIATLVATLAKDSHLSLVAYSNAGTPALAAVGEEDDRPDKGTAKLRFFNTASSDSGAIDAYLIASTGDCAALSTATAVATAISGLQTAFTAINPSATTPYRLCVTAAGDRTDLRLDADLTVGDREVVTVILTRTAGAVLLNGMVLVQQGAVTSVANGFARVRLAVGTTAGPVTATFGTTSLGTSLAAPSLGAYRLVKVTTPATDPFVAVPGFTVTLPTGTIAGGGDYTLLVADTATPGTVAAALLPDDNARSTNGAKPVKIRIVHGANNANDASLSVGSDFIGSVARGTESAYILTEASGAAATLIEVTAGGVKLCGGTATLSAAPTVYSVFVLGTLPATPLGACILRADR